VDLVDSVGTEAATADDVTGAAALGADTRPYWGASSDRTSANLIMDAALVGSGAGGAEDEGGMCAPKDGGGMGAPKNVGGMCAPKDGGGMGAPKDEDGCAPKDGGGMCAPKDGGGMGAPKNVGGMGALKDEDAMCAPKDEDGIGADTRPRAWYWGASSDRTSPKLIMDAALNGCGVGAGAA
jgi:hypothetical protein